MAHRSALVAVSVVQLAAQLAGQVVALRRRRYFDTPLPLLTGDPAHVGRDSLWAGTAFSAPAHMMVAQAWATARVARGDDLGRQVLRVLGAVMVPGYLLERSARQSLRPGGVDPVETSIVAVALSGAVAMVVLARR
ncbi:hypothetical protein [Blastococcus sp. PRF04-17]|uniref:hypothetical protein n=1 Tax=Blastococcus sp. PRF04-17 TaxID=2933797 RepID=UPI001FF4627D|nr:hypothetical protein [Blastococcus sp. PRF04-17]UOY00738.1 hypothetical protein MVA48_17375 [Blastococcus sp. PRF04-17]